MCKQCRWPVAGGPYLASHARAQHHLAAAVPSNVGLLRSMQAPLHESGSTTGLGDGACMFCKLIMGPQRQRPDGAASPRQAQGSHHSVGRSRAWGATSVNMAIAARELPGEGFHAIDGAVEPLHGSHGQAGASESAWAAPPSRRAGRAAGSGGARRGRAGPCQTVGPSGKIPIPGLLWPESPPRERAAAHEPAVHARVERVGHDRQPLWPVIRP